MAAFTQADVVRILANMDALAGTQLPDRQRAWAHLFIAAGLIQKELADPEMLTRERFMEAAGQVHDHIYKALRAGVQS